MIPVEYKINLKLVIAFIKNMNFFESSQTQVYNNASKIHFFRRIFLELEVRSLTLSSSRAFCHSELDVAARVHVQSKIVL
jgi:hypothetical protein